MAPLDQKNGMTCLAHDQYGKLLVNGPPCNCPAPSPSNQEREWWDCVGNILQDVEPLGPITYALTDNQMKAILAEQHKRTIEACIEILQKERKLIPSEPTDYNLGAKHALSGCIQAIKDLTP